MDTVSGSNIEYIINNDTDVSGIVSTLDSINNTLSNFNDTFSSISSKLTVLNNFLDTHTQLVAIAVGILVFILIYSIFKVSLKWFNKFF